MEDTFTVALTGLSFGKFYYIDLSATRTEFVPSRQLSLFFLTICCPCTILTNLIRSLVDDLH